MSRVAILQPVIADYRVPFYLRLEQSLRERDIDLTVFASSPEGRTFLRDGLDELAFACRVRSAPFGRLGYWQGSAARFAGFELVVLQQELRALTNYPVILKRRVLSRPRRLALWGHGTNLGADGDPPLIRRWREHQIRAVDHYFAYTEMSRRIFIEHGAPPESVTVVNNSIDVSDVLNARERSTPEWRRKWRHEMGLLAGPVAVFCGRLTEKKNLPFLIDACRIVKHRLPGFSLLIIGDGARQSWIDHVAREEPWIRLAGPLHGVHKAHALCLGDALCMPYDLGLSILDGFAAGLPAIVARDARHNPEIAYLEDGRNGAVSARSVAGYADTVVDLLSDPARLQRMSRAASDTARRFSLEAMVRNFTDGIRAALADVHRLPGSTGTSARTAPRDHHGDCLEQDVKVEP